MNKAIFLTIILISFCSLQNLSLGQSVSRISESMEDLLTYPYSDPDPIAANQKLYPYYRFDGFSHEGVLKSWKVITLENDYLRIQILPEIGGKIWTAYDKVSKRDFIYKNNVIKFRDIAMRGPWTSGGIEANYGVIGHTPNTSTSVDYLTKTNMDGSASCVVHTFDMLSRTRWTLEIKLEKDKGYFSTKSFWHNSNPIEMPYYTWMNLAVPASDDLQFIYPGHQYIGHDGKAHNWPKDDKGRDLSNYNENAFGSSKSYHVLGAPSGVFGAYYQSVDAGMARYAHREDKLGKKIFLWAQSGSGKIWEDLLTDADGQYVEIQSGRLFNQNAFTSSETPFKQIGFKPYQTDQWEEFWFPFQSIGKPQVINLYGAFHIINKGNELIINIDPKVKIEGTIYALDNEGQPIGNNTISGNIGERVTCHITLNKDITPKSILFNNIKIDLTSDSYPLERPMQSDQKISQIDSLSLLARDLLRFRLFGEAEPVVLKAYKLAPTNLSVLGSMVKLSWFKMDYQNALVMAKKGLAIDTYDPEINYYYGLLQEKFNKTYDAIDGYQIASLDFGWRSAAYTRLALLYFKDMNYALSLSYADKALQNNKSSIEALQLAYLTSKILKKEDTSQKFIRAIEQIDPLSPFLNFESYYQHMTPESESKFLNAIKQEMGADMLLELAIWYSNLGIRDKAIKILEIAPKNIETYLWLAWLNKENADAELYLKQAYNADLKLVFPFREESSEIFNWAIDRRNHWKAGYLQALLYRFRNQPEKALNLLKSGTDSTIDFAPLFALRGQMYPTGQKEKAISDLIKASQLDPNEWRYGKLLSNLYRMNKQYDKGLVEARTIYNKFPKNYILGMNYIKMLLLNEKFTEAETALSQIAILPFEGATDGHRYYEQVKLMLAHKAYEKNDRKSALNKIDESRLWPKNLGVGEPYSEEKQELLADFLQYKIYSDNSPEKAASVLNKMIGTKEPKHFALLLIQALAYEKSGDSHKAKELISKAASLDVNGVKKRLLQLRNESVNSYWPNLLTSIYQGEDQRMF